MITTLLFDLDGVLVHTEEIHRNSLTRAVQEISHGETYVSEFDGLSTRAKIIKLCDERGWDFSRMYPAIDYLKQKYTVEELMSLKADPDLSAFFHELGNFNYQIALCSNTRRANMDIILDRLGIADKFEFTIAGDEGFPQKPYPDIYISAMGRFGVLPMDTVILEDSVVGCAAAEAAGAYLYKVEREKKLNWEDLYNGLVEADHHCANGRYGVTIS